MVWPMIAMAAVSAVGSIVQSNQASAQNETQQAWNQYNAQMGYNTSMSNIQSQTMLGMFNASMQMKAAELNAGATLDMAKFNSQQVRDTVEYNNLLLDEEERLLWEAADLDVHLIEEQRQAERGDIVATQASSGITIGTGSHADVVIEQRAQEAMDTFVIRHNADVGASKIQNARAQNIWQGESQVQKIMYEGEVGAAMSMNNARLSSMGTMAETFIGADANKRSATFQLSSGMSGASVDYSANQAQISSNLTSGLFSAASSAYGAYSARPVTGASASMGSLMTTSTPDHYGR